ncbi:MAG: methyl-accepting chemotaxis protein [Gammaproteobacteria bacterium]|nr:methyl-accepting chemotaxis protein [Gammaproteobacteria bacterium]
MKINQPTTNNEVLMKEGAILVSRTNLKGAITYANRAFIEISGFNEEELIGKNHNMVRHPDMLEEAFDDLWQTLKQGDPWVGFIKNRCKNGDFYWVKATVSPVFKQGQVVEYMSVRSKPSVAQVAAAEALYAEVSLGNAHIRKKGLSAVLEKISSVSMFNQLLMINVVLAGFFLFGFLVMADEALLHVVMENANSLAVLFGTMGLLAAGLSYVVCHRLYAGLAKATSILAKLSEGNYDNYIKTSSSKIGQLMKSLLITQSRLSYGMHEVVEKADEGQRLKTALDNMSGSVMIADNQRNIIYMNKQVERLFNQAETDIRKDLPDFNSAQLKGASIDLFHKHPKHQEDLLAALKETYVTEIKLGGRSLQIVANPIIDDDGSRLGTSVEWMDRTAEIKTEDEVTSLIVAARSGDLGQRLALQGKEGFLLNLSEGVNSLMQGLEQAFADISQAMQSMSEGDLTKTIERDYEGVFDQVKRSINSSMVNFEEVVSKLRESSDMINTSALEISTGNNNLSARTEQQASSLQQTASSMEELTSTVRNNADNSQQANQLATGARQTAEHGGEVVSRAVQAMDAINTSSNKISEIIGVIDEIAFQTNLLALNASVEAARAGEQGRGFAVVATEVRNLAGRSATAAKEIKLLIQDSAEKVNVGATLVSESGETLNEIVHSVKKVGDIISEIAAASQQQSSGIEQVNRAVTNMDEVTQQNAALAEQTSAAAASLTEKAKQMEQMIQFFKVGERSQRMRSGSSRTGGAALEFAQNKPLSARTEGRTSSQTGRQVVTNTAESDEWEDF